MAIHKKWRQTYFSTPSSLTHSAYPFWSGALFNRGRAKADKVDIDLTHSNLARGLLCPDGQYRQIVTVEDAVRGGCNLFDLDQLRMEYSPDIPAQRTAGVHGGQLGSLDRFSGAGAAPVWLARSLDRL
ncbi:terminase%2C ATPase subunit [Salmonella enterica subsp. enterica serovar Typhi]|nr:terminase%2C ATPase subunit [Salmonella enterica subsp. enterica serovar Typhi]